ncbi:hypothetical protein DFP72DRAFT_1117982 [Ephemerocybe angulata]|uniref:Uncharacterized protein n=1 Tax=Ephemerocybe angulata TaxID=980116 RepID=A0A8H6LT27_9AGAR|nr:hypothetical protein DFP72DRAFT_1117982 [Tulosesus angulatus]
MGHHFRFDIGRRAAAPGERFASEPAPCPPRDCDDKGWSGLSIHTAQTFEAVREHAGERVYAHCTSSGDHRRGVSWSLARSNTRTLREEVYLASSSPLGAVPGAFGTSGPSLPLPFVVPPSPVESSVASTSSFDSDSLIVAKTRAAGPASPPLPTPQKPKRRVRSVSSDSLRVQFQTPVGNRDVPPHIKQTPRTPRLRPAIWGDINRLRFTPPPVNDDDSLKSPSPPFDFDKHYQDFLERKRLEKKMPEGDDDHREPSPHRDESPMPSTYASLPGKNERRAPRWDAVPRTLGEFLDDYEELCSECGAGEAQMIDTVSSGKT